ncbi:MAG: guanylate kinase [Lachnospiraceae bacterium]|nr:guanylate kinase [Lachnospiraceae bacterium]
MKQTGLIIVLSGFSGAGKGTIMKHLLQNHPGEFNLSISATTRKKRQGEVDGRDYFFKTREEFDSMIENGDLLEYATFNNNSYGTPKSYVEKLVNEGKDVLLEIEIQGALQVKKIFPEAVLLFVMPPSADALKERLVGRGTETEDVVAERLAISNKEAEFMPQYDYLIVNDILENAVEQVYSIISSEHSRTARNVENIEKIKQDLKKFERS